MQFGRYLHERGWNGLYAPVDAVLDGTDLENWNPPRADYFVAIEVVEHIHDPWALIISMTNAARNSVVLTTPNSEVIDVITCDPTHVSIVPALELWDMGYTVTKHSWFGKPEDSLLAWKSKS